MFGQKGHEMRTVNSNEMMYFTWDNVVEERIMTVRFDAGLDVGLQGKVPNS